MKLFTILVARLHYFFWYAALAEILPYYVVYVRDRASFSPIVTGTLFSFLPFLSFLLNPIFCALADRSDKHHAFLIIFINITLLAFGSLIILPWVSAKASSILAAILLIIAHPSMVIATTLADSLVMRIVSQIEDEEKDQGWFRPNYGNIRVWGTIGFGVFGLFSGWLNKLQIGLPYLVPGIIMFILLMIIDVITVKMGLYDFAKLELKLKRDQTCPIERGEDLVDDDEVESFTKKCPASTPHKKFCSLVKNNPSIIQHCICLTTLGILDSFYVSYFFWFLDGISPKNTMLMGLCLLVRSFVGEVVFFQFGSRIVDTLGASNCFSISMACWCIRFLCYSYLIQPSNAYFVLFVEVLQGPAFSLLHCAMTHLGQEYAVKGSSESDEERPEKERVEAPGPDEKNSRVHSALQGLLAGCRHGFGPATGCFLGGFILQHFDITRLWTFASILALIGLLFNGVCDFLNWLISKYR